MKKLFLMLSLFLISTNTISGSGDNLVTQFVAQDIGNNVVQYQYIVATGALATLYYAFTSGNSVKENWSLFLQFCGATFGGGVALAILYSTQFNNVIPKELTVFPVLHAMNQAIPLFTAAAACKAMYDYCISFDEKDPKASSGKSKGGGTTITVNNK